jgi:hypothetical protein
VSRTLTIVLLTFVPNIRAPSSGAPVATTPRRTVSARKDSGALPESGISPRLHPVGCRT